MTKTERKILQSRRKLIGELQSELDYPQAQDRKIRAKLIAVQEFQRIKGGYYE